MRTYKLLPVLVLIAAFIMAGCGTTAALTTLPRSVAALPAVATLAPQKVADVVTAPSTAQQPQAPVTGSTSLSAFEGTFEQIYSQVNPSVVNIQVIIGAASGSTSQSGRGNGNGNGNGNTSPFGNSPFGNSPFGGSPQQGTPQGEALGSGFVWDNQGHIVTNNHVVSGATSISVTFSDGNTYDAKLVGTDPNADLAVIQVNAPSGELHPVTLADSSQVKVGQVAIAIGNPYGLSGTMTQGIVSALSRSLPVQSSSSSQFGQSGGSYTIPDIIQTDAAINPGNSGGVLLNDQGQVIGVTAAIQSQTDSNAGIGFVIPSNIVNKVVPSLISTGNYAHPYLGISGTDMTSDVATAMNLKAGQRGVLVISVAANGPAAKAGLQGSSQNQLSQSSTPTGGDVITGIDGHAVNSFTDLTSYLFNNTKVGQTVTLTILRNGQQQNVQVTLGQLPSTTATQ